MILWRTRSPANPHHDGQPHRFFALLPRWTDEGLVWMEHIYRTWQLNSTTPHYVYHYDYPGRNRVVVGTDSTGVTRRYILLGKDIPEGFTEE